jgi:hypothetical protein
MSHDDSDLVSARSRRLSALLRDTDPPVPAIAFPAGRIARATRHRSVVRWRAAAAIVLALAGAIGVRPVRAWIVQAARTVWAATLGEHRTGGAEPAPPAGAGAVTFTPAAGSFAVRVAHPQAGGTLTVETTAGESATASLAGGRGEAELVVLPDGLRIVNDSLSSASYLVKVPARLARIEVGIAGRTTRVLVPPASGAVARWVMDLGAPR